MGAVAVAEAAGGGNSYGWGAMIRAGLPMRLRMPRRTQGRARSRIGLLGRSIMEDTRAMVMVLRLRLRPEDEDEDEDEDEAMASVVSAAHSVQGRLRIPWRAAAGMGGAPPTNQQTHHHPAGGLLLLRWRASRRIPRNSLHHVSSAAPASKDVWSSSSPGAEWYSPARRVGNRILGFLAAAVVVVVALLTAGRYL